MNTNIDDYFVPPHMLMASPEEKFRQKVLRFMRGTETLTNQAAFHAKYWKLVTQVRETEKGHFLGEGILEMHLCCAEDLQSVWRLMSGGTSYSTEIYDIEQGVMRHILQCHREVIDGKQGDQELDSSVPGDPDSERSAVRAGSQDESGYTQRS